MIHRDSQLLLKPGPFTATAAVNHRPSGPPEQDWFPVILPGSGQLRLVTVSSIVYKECKP